MLEITVPGRELFDEKTMEFSHTDPITLELEHSLLSISKWEQKTHEPFLVHDQANPLSYTQMLEYIKCMTVFPKKVDPIVYASLSSENIKMINDYISDSMTATRITERNKKAGPSRITTSEVLYSAMFRLSIPLELERWHLNRLITLIRVCEAEENQTPMSKKDILAENRALNAMRRSKTGSRG